MGNINNNTAQLQEILELLQTKAFPTSAVTEELEEVLEAQETKIAELSAILDTKAAGESSVEAWTGTLISDMKLGDYPDDVYVYIDPTLTTRIIVIPTGGQANIQIAAGTTITYRSMWDAVEMSEQELIETFTKSEAYYSHMIIINKNGFIVQGGELVEESV